MPEITPACRSCGERNLTPILALGDMPLANRLLTDEQLRYEEPCYPLNLVFCTHCNLAQITHPVAPEELVDEGGWRSSSEAAHKQSRALAAQVMAAQRLRPTSLVVEIASQDGQLLSHYQAAGIPVLGIEPAVKLARIASKENNVPTWCRRFTRRLGEALFNCDLRADVVHARGVLAHVSHLNDFLAGIHEVLKDRGVAILEVPYVKDLVDNVEFDAIYHEHACYFSLTSLTGLLNRAHLVIHDVERVPHAGGSLRVYVGREGECSARVSKLLKEEKSWGVDRATFYQALAERVEQVRRELVALLTRLKAEGRRIAVYGAGAKGNVLLNYCKIGGDTIDFVVDRDAQKQGRYTPGTHLKIYSPDKLVQEQPDYVLLLSRGFTDEILAQEAAYRRHGGRFIIPIPCVKVAS